MLTLHCVWTNCIWNENGECSADEVSLEEGAFFSEGLICKKFDFRDEDSSIGGRYRRNAGRIWREIRQ